MSQNILYNCPFVSRHTPAAGQVEKFCPESCCVVGNYYSLKGQHERAVTYFQRAIRLNSRYCTVVYALFVCAVVCSRCCIC